MEQCWWVQGHDGVGEACQRKGSQLITVLWAKRQFQYFYEPAPEMPRGWLCVKTDCDFSKQHGLNLALALAFDRKKEPTAGPECWPQMSRTFWQSWTRDWLQDPAASEESQDLSWPWRSNHFLLSNSFSQAAVLYLFLFLGCHATDDLNSLSLILFSRWWGLIQAGVSVSSQLPCHGAAALRCPLHWSRVCPSALGRPGSGNPSKDNQTMLQCFSMLSVGIFSHRGAGKPPQGKNLQ